MTLLNQNLNVVEVILSGAPALSLKESILNKNNISDFRVSLSVGDLSNVDNYIVTLPKDIYHEEIICDLKEDILNLINLAKLGYKIRIWSSHVSPDSYLLLMFICSCLKNNTDNIYVVYSDEYKEECYSPFTMTSDELVKLSNLEHILSNSEISELSDKWDIVVKDNSNVRIVEDRNIKSVSYEYFDDEIIDILANQKSTRIIDLTYELSNKYHINDSVFVFLISRLISLSKIKIIDNNKQYILSVIKGIDPNE